MQEAEFWAKFFQSHYFHRERAAEVNAKDPFSDCIKMDETGIIEAIFKFNIFNFRYARYYTKRGISFKTNIKFG